MQITIITNVFMLRLHLRGKVLAAMLDANVHGTIEHKVVLGNASVAIGIMFIIKPLTNEFMC